MLCIQFESLMLERCYGFDCSTLTYSAYGCNCNAETGTPCRCDGEVFFCAIRWCVLARLKFRLLDKLLPISHWHTNISWFCSVRNGFCPRVTWCSVHYRGHSTALYWRFSPRSEQRKVTTIHCAVSPQVYRILSGFRYWCCCLKMAVERRNT